MIESELSYLAEHLKLPDPALKEIGYDINQLHIIFYIAKKLCPGFKRTPKLDEIYTEGLKYFCGNKTSKFNIEKGLFVCGKIGTGKTLFFRVMVKYIKLREKQDWSNGFISVGALKVVQDYEQFGSVAISCCGNRNYEIKESLAHLLIDDIGQHQDDCLHFGTQRNVISELLATRYDIFLKYNRLTHITTNLLPDEIGERYGKHIQSRAKEMFNLVKFTGPDLRK